MPDSVLGKFVMCDPLEKQDHRPWPLPRRAWIMAQVWQDLLFAHWPIEPDSIRSIIPPALELDTFNGQAWLGVVPFRITGLRLRGLPAIPYLSAFPEINLRTYVTHSNKPGVWFFSLDVTNPAAVVAARLWFHLPYFHSNMNIVEDDKGFTYHSDRSHRGAPRAAFKARYRPTGKAFEAELGSIDHWLTERYCLYSHSPRRVYRAEIHHRPWQLQPAECEISVNSMTAQLKVPLPGIPPLLHFAKVQDVRVWAPRSIADTASRRR